jgi:energy-coupling factor transporter ATP-binding protein EcfA2
VALATVLAQRRRIVLLDEPTLGLDAEGRARLADLLARLHGRGAAYWIASHDADFLAATCDRIVALEDGRVAHDGPAAAFWADPDRARRLGVPVPQACALAARLRDVGLPPLSPGALGEDDLLQHLAGLGRAG